MLLVSSFSVYSQVKPTTISGKISSDESGIIEFASIIIKGSTNGTNTDENGAYSFSAPSGTHTIIVSALGYTTVEKTVSVKKGQNNVFDFVLTSGGTTLNEVLVTGKTAAQKINELAYNVVALDAKLLHNTTLDLSHALDRISGVRVRESGGVGSNYTFSLNGFSGRQVKFFIDGVPMENFGSSFQINNIPINLAERLEVYKGVVPISLGADALGGAVNIVTSNKEGKYIDASYSYGSFNTHRSYINAGYTAKSGFTVQVNAFQNYSDNDYKVITDVANEKGEYIAENVKLRRFHDKYHNETLIANVGVVGKSYADKLLVGVTLGQNRADVQNGARMKEFVYGKRFRRGNTIMPSIKYQKYNLFVEGLDLRVNGNFNLGYEQTVDTAGVKYNWYGESYRPEGKVSEQELTMYKYKNNLGIVAANLNYKLTDQHTFTVNNVYTTFNRKGEDPLNLSSESYKQPRKTKKNVIGLGYKFDYNDAWSTSFFVKEFHQQTTSFREEEGPGGWGSKVFIPIYNTHDALGYGLASSYFVTEKVQIKASYEKSLRMPDHDELFGNDGLSMLGNMDLKPETSHNFNLGANLTTHINRDHGLILDASLLYRDTKDYIRMDVRSANAAHKYNMLNEGKILNYGINAEGRYSYKRKLTAGINMTYQNVYNGVKYEGEQDHVSGTYKARVPNLPYLFGNADCSIFFSDIFQKGSKLTLGYNGLFVYKYYLRWPINGGSSTKYNIPTQISHDLNATYTLKDGMYNIALECRNVLDEDLYDNFSLQKPGRSFSIKFRYFFSKQ